MTAEKFRCRKRGLEERRRASLKLCCGSLSRGLDQERTGSQYLKYSLDRSVMLGLRHSMFEPTSWSKFSLRRIQMAARVFHESQWPTKSENGDGKKAAESSMKSYLDTTPKEKPDLESMPWGSVSEEE